MSEHLSSVAQLLPALAALAAILKWLNAKPAHIAPVPITPDPSPPRRAPTRSGDRGPPESPAPSPSTPPRPPAPFSPGAAARPVVLARVGFEDAFAVAPRRLERMAA